MKRFWALVLVVLMVLGMVACGTPAASTNSSATPAETPKDSSAAPAEKQKMTLMMYTNTAIQETIEKLIVPFEEANNVDVEVVLVSLADYDTKLSTMISSGESPDVMLVAEYQNVQYTEENMLLPLNDIISGADYDYEDFAAGQRSHWTFDDKVYGIACSGAPLVLFYNKDLYAKAGLETPSERYEKGTWTAEAMIEDAKTIANLGDDIYGIDFSRAGDWANWDVVMTPVLRMYGGDAWNDADRTEVLINSKKSIKGLETLNELMNTGVHPKAGTTIDFLAGQLGLYPELFGSIKKMVDLPFEWDMVPMPVNADGGSTSWMGSAAWGVLTASDTPDLAKSLVQFMTTKKFIEDMQFTFVPTRKSVLLSEAYTTGNSGEIARSSNEKAHGWIIESIDLIRVKQSPANYQELSEVIMEGLDLMYAGAMAPADAADYIAENMAPYMDGKN